MWSITLETETKLTKNIDVHRSNREQGGNNQELGTIRLEHEELFNNWSPSWPTWRNRRPSWRIRRPSWRLKNQETRMMEQKTEIENIRKMMMKARSDFEWVGTTLGKSSKKKTGMKRSGWPIGLTPLPAWPILFVKSLGLFSYWM